MRVTKRAAARSLLVTSLFQLLLDLPPTNVDVQDVTAVPEDKAQTLSCLQIGFGVACHLTKPLTGANQQYLVTRWAVAAESLKGSGVDLGIYDKTGLLLSLLPDLPDLANIVTPPNIVAAVTAGKADPYDSTRTAVLSQIEMIYKFSGMTTINLMTYFVLIPTNVALTIPAVLEPPCRTFDVSAHARTHALNW